MTEKKGTRPNKPKEPFVNEHMKKIALREPLSEKAIKKAKKDPANHPTQKIGKKTFAIGDIPKFVAFDEPRYYEKSPMRPFYRATLGKVMEEEKYGKRLFLEYSPEDDEGILNWKFYMITEKDEIDFADCVMLERPYRFFPYEGLEPKEWPEHMKVMISCLLRNIKDINERYLCRKTLVKVAGLKPLETGVEEWDQYLKTRKYRKSEQ